MQATAHGRWFKIRLVCLAWSLVLGLASPFLQPSALVLVDSETRFTFFLISLAMELIGIPLVVLVGLSFQLNNPLRGNKSWTRPTHEDNPLFGWGSSNPLSALHFASWMFAVYAAGLMLASLFRPEVFQQAILVGVGSLALFIGLRLSMIIFKSRIQEPGLQPVAEEIPPQTLPTPPQSNPRWKFLSPLGRFMIVGGLLYVVLALLLGFKHTDPVPLVVRVMCIGTGFFTIVIGAVLLSIHRRFVANCSRESEGQK